MADERWADRPWWLKRPQPRFGLGRSLRAAMHLRGSLTVVVQVIVLIVIIVERSNGLRR